MLEEHEWEQIAPDLQGAIRQIKEYRERHSTSLAESRRLGYGQKALERYFEITGYRESEPDNLWHHRADIYGPPCSICGKPLRTPRAKICAECGAPAKQSD
jgi:hypothetical protein